MPKKEPRSRQRFRDEFGSEPIVDGKKVPEYVGFLETDCNPHWMSTWSKMKKIDDKTPIKSKASYNKAKAKCDKFTQHEEKCAGGGGGGGEGLKNLATFKREMQEKYE